MDKFCCEHVTRRYQGQNVIEDISLTLREGELVSLLGASGVGKTTLMGVLSGVDRPDEGGVFLDGAEITGRAGAVSYMLQKDLLLPYKTIIDNVSLPLRLRGNKKKEARVAAQPHFTQFGLEGYENLYPHQLSGGMRQRAALLRTWLAGNSVLLLDEPFSALDAITKAEMHRWYLSILAEIRTTTLFITHDVDEAVFLSDRIYVLAGKPGRITQEILVEIPRPRNAESALTETFLQYKRAVLRAISAQEQPKAL